MPPQNRRSILIRMDIHGLPSCNPPLRKQRKKRKSPLHKRDPPPETGGGSGGETTEMLISAVPQSHDRLFLFMLVTAAIPAQSTKVINPHSFMAGTDATACP